MILEQKCSSFSYLHKSHDRLKLVVLLSSIFNQIKMIVIVRAVIAMAKNLNLEVLAEGVKQ